MAGDLNDLARFLQLTPDAIGRVVGPALFVAGKRVETAAQISITEGAVSGAGHVPSVAPNAPNNDTGVLANNIETVQINRLKVEVSSNAPYAAAQEFGPPGRPDQARPYMAPAALKEKGNAEKIVQRAVKQAVRNASRGLR